MLELRGKYNTCKVFTDNVDSATIGQVTALLNQQSLAGSNIRIMPETHAGKGCVIGTTMTITDKVIPNLVGVDIACGMLTTKLNTKRIELPKLDSVINKNIPSGFSIRDKEHKYCNSIDLSMLKCAKAVNLDRAYKSIGTLGGGNHFIEVDTSSNGELYLVIHTGSRNLGKQIAEFYQDLAWQSIKNGTKEREQYIQQVIKQLTVEGRQSEINTQIKLIKDRFGNIPKELAYCTGELFSSYIHDMRIAQEYANLNRLAIADTILKEMKIKPVDSFTTLHNYIDLNNMILRKGAVSAQLNERLLIPINMRDGSLVCVGKGNPDWNFSAPHGSGRILSRSEAKQRLTVSEFKKTMKEAGIYSTSVNSSTLDESPMAYKPMQEIINNIQPTAEIIDIIKPIYNFKASGD